ncbi:MAG: hypothetical protein RIS56_2239 [Verrucomicrobiota bacterium]|jgi:hypothetical protein
MGQNIKKDIKMNNPMKTVNNRHFLGSCIAVAMALATWLPTTAIAADEAKPMKPMKGGEHLLMLKGVETKGEVDALKTDDSIAMVCAKCKTVWVARVKQGTKGAQLLMEMGQPKELIGTHGCAGCNSTLTVTGHAKGDITKLNHSCKMCGDDSAFCCATKPGSGATKGMEKPKL